MNSRGEFNRCHIPRLVLDPDDQKFVTRQPVDVLELDQMEHNYTGTRISERDRSEQETRKGASRYIPSESVKRLDSNPSIVKDKNIKKRRLDYQVLADSWGENILVPPLTEPVSEGERVPPEPAELEILNAERNQDSSEQDQNLIVREVNYNLASTRPDSICQNNTSGSVVPVLADKPVLPDTTSTTTISQVVLPDSSTDTTPGTQIVQGRGELFCSGTDKLADCDHHTVVAIMDSLDIVNKWNSNDGTILTVAVSDSDSIISVTMKEQESEIQRYNQENRTPSAPSSEEYLKLSNLTERGVGTDSYSVCDIKKGGWCGTHNCQARRTIRTGSQWSKNSAGLYSRKRTSKTVWTCPNLDSTTNVILKASQINSSNTIQLQQQQSAGSSYKGGGLVIMIERGEQIDYKR